MARIVDGWVVHGDAQPPSRGKEARPRGAIWWRRVAAVVLAAVAVRTNPGRSEEGFRHFLRAQRSVAVAHRFAEAVGLIEVRVRNLFLASLGFEGRRLFIGAFDQWIELPQLLGAWRELSLDWPTARDVDGLLLAFVLVWAAWQCYPRLMSRHFLASSANFRAGRVWALPAALLAHIEWDHLLSNCLFLYSAGPPAHSALGRRRFFFLYFLGGSCAAAASLLLTPYLRRSQPYVEYVGASGSLFALLGYLAHSREGIRWLGNEWRWQEFLLIQLLLGAGLKFDALAHVVGAMSGWAASEWGLLERL